MYTLYYDAGASNMAAYAALEEIGVPYDLVLIDTDNDAQNSEAYLKLNPHARVPTLVHDDLVMYESTAILVFLCDRHPEAGLAPAFDAPLRALYLQWLVYLTTTVQETLQHNDHPEFFVPDEASQEALKTHAEYLVDGMWRVIDDALGTGSYLLGNDFSACDYLISTTGRFRRVNPCWDRKNWSFPKWPRALLHSDAEWYRRREKCKQ